MPASLLPGWSLSDLSMLYRCIVIQRCNMSLRHVGKTGMSQPVLMPRHV